MEDEKWAQYEEFLKDYKKATAFDRYHWLRDWFWWIPQPIKQFIELIKNFYRFERLCEKYKDTQNYYIVKHLLKESSEWLVTVSKYNSLYWWEVSQKIDFPD